MNLAHVYHTVILLIPTEYNFLFNTQRNNRYQSRLINCKKYVIFHNIYYFLLESMVFFLII